MILFRSYVTEESRYLVKPYANLCGLFALANSNECDKYEEALKSTALKEAPIIN